MPVAERDPTQAGRADSDGGGTAGLPCPEFVVRDAAHRGALRPRTVPCTRPTAADEAPAKSQTPTIDSRPAA